MKEVKKINKNLRYFLWTILGIIILGSISVLANNLVFSNSKSNYLQYSNGTYNVFENETGLFCGNSTKTIQLNGCGADVCVSRGTDALEDFCYQKNGDVVVLSTDNSTDTSIKLNSAMNGGNKSVYISQGIYNLNNGTSTTSSRITICGDNNLKIYGAGIDKTILFNNGFHVNCATPTENIDISDMTIDLNKSANNGINSLVTAAGTKEMYITRVKIQNSSNLPLLQGSICGGTVRDSIFIDAGLSTAKDNIVLSNDCEQSTGMGATTKFINNDVIKRSSLGGAGLSNGGSHNLLIDGNYFEDTSGLSYSAISMEGQNFNMTDIIITNNIINYNLTEGFAGEGDINIGGSSSRIIERIIISNNIGSGLSIIVGDVKEPASDVIISNNEVTDGVYGIFVTNMSNSKIIGNVIKNSNFKNSSISTDKALRVSNSYNLTITDNTIIKTDLRNNVAVYGIRLTESNSIYLKGNNFFGILDANRYTFTTSTDYMIDNYFYTNAINNTNYNPSLDVFNKETIFNQTNGCKSNGTAWKCWSMT